jgi:hypothetical protein
MGNEFRRRCANGEEELVHTSERHLVIMHRGESTMIKRRTNRRERREEKRELRSSDSG